MKFGILLVFTLAFLGAQSQDSLWTKRLAFQQKANRIGMISLVSWSMSNLAGGLYYRSETSGSTKYFHEMNAMWNTVNFGIGVAGLIQEFKQKQVDYPEYLKLQKKYERIFLINSGLDLIYIGVGSTMSFSGKSNERSTGYGQSLMLQGGYLLLFDGLMYVIHRKNRPVTGFENVSLSLGLNQFHVVYRL